MKRFDHFVTVVRAFFGVGLARIHITQNCVDKPVRLPSYPRSVCHAGLDHFVTSGGHWVRSLCHTIL